MATNTSATRMDQSAFTDLSALEQTELVHILGRLHPRHRRWFREMFKRSCAEGTDCELEYAAMLLCNLIIDDHNQASQITLNRQMIPKEKPKRKRRPQRFSKNEREEVKQAVFSGAIRPDSPIALLVGAEEAEEEQDKQDE